MTEKNMNCPRCNKEMLQFQAGDISAKTCAECYGMWFEAGMLEKAVERKWLPEKFAPESAIGHTVPSCPDCGGSLITVKTISNPALNTFACTICQGRWIEASEFKKFMPASLWQKFKIWLSG